MNIEQEHHYARHIEIIIAFLALFLLGMGIYQITNGQIEMNSGNSKYDKFYDVNEYNKDLIKGVQGTVQQDSKVIEAYKEVPILVPIKPTVNVRTGNNGDVSSRSRSYTGGATTSNTNTGGTTGTGAQGKNTGNNKSNNGFYESGPIPTQGVNVNSKGVYDYGQGGLNEWGAIPTQGYVTNGNGGSMYGTRGLNEAPATLSASQIVPASLSKPTSDNVNFKNCAAFTKYHAFGDKGGDVATIQMFLKEKGYYKGTISGVYGITTFKAVQAFQKDYSKEILNPWGIEGQATGRWYKSTTYKANKILGCPQPAVYLERVNKLLDY
jgi:hypothetical protein